MAGRERMARRNIRLSAIRRYLFVARSWNVARPIAYGAAVTTNDGVVCMGGNDSETTLDQVFLMQWDPAEKGSSC